MTTTESEVRPRRWLIVHGTHAGIVGEELSRMSNREGEFVILQLPESYWPRRQVSKRIDCLQAER